MPTVKIKGFTINLPYTPYPSQVITMQTILQSLINSESSLIESPTGTGKTLSILCSVLSFKKDNNVKIFICSRTHKQIDQIIKELKTTSYNPKITILASRNHYCIHPLIKNESDKTKSCKDLIKKNSCQYFKNKDNLKNKLIDIEDLKKEGKKLKACPFYFSRGQIDKSDIIFAPYNYLIDPSIRNAMEIKLENSVVIIDEAHNIEDFCRSAGSLKLDSKFIDYMGTDILKILKKGLLEEEDKKSLFEILDLLKKVKSISEYINKNNNKRKCLNKEYTFETKENEMERSSWNLDKPFKKYEDDNNEVITGNKIVEILTNVGIDKEKILRTKVLCQKFVKNDELKDIMSANTIQTLETLCFVLENIIFKNSHGYSMAVIKRFTDFTLNFYLLDPGVIFVPLACEVKSIILLSGTLTPFKTFSSELGHKFTNQVEAPHVINQNNVFIACLEKGHLNAPILGTYKNVESKEYILQLHHIINEIRKKIQKKGGVLVFVPSYAFLEKIEKKLKEESNIFIEPSNNLSFDKVYNSYKRSIENKDSPVFVCVFRGRASEGMDFKDEYARAVLIVGIPFPSYKDLEITSKRSFNDNYKSVNGRVWYEIQAYRAVNQAIGRVVRHKDDWGGVFLLDCRYKEDRVRNNLSKWVKNNINSYNELKKCLNDFGTFVNNK